MIVINDKMDTIVRGVARSPLHPGGTFISLPQLPVQVRNSASMIAGRKSTGKRATSACAPLGYSRDAGLCIDHFLLSPAVAKRLKGAVVDREVRGWPKTTDHAPVWIELTDEKKPKRKAKA